jgi:hypothetical protein
MKVDLPLPVDIKNKVILLVDTFIVAKFAGGHQTY